MYHDWLKVVAKTVEKYAHLNQAINTEGVNDQYIKSFKQFLITDIDQKLMSGIQTGENFSTTPIMKQI